MLLAAKLETLEKKVDNAVSRLTSIEKGISLLLVKQMEPVTRAIERKHSGILDLAEKIKEHMRGQAEAHAEGTTPANVRFIEKKLLEAERTILNLSPRVSMNRGLVLSPRPSMNGADSPRISGDSPRLSVRTTPEVRLSGDSPRLSARSTPKGTPLETELSRAESLQSAAQAFLA